MSVAALLLAAGASSRWGEGRPKALLPWRGLPLVAQLARAALDVGAAPVVRVLGAHAAAIQTAAPAEAGVADEFNPDWASGMGGSIACGLRAALARAPEAEGVLIVPCDQPLVDAGLLAGFVAALGGEPGRIVQSDYGDGACGPPVAFGREFFPELLALSGDEGGRVLVRRHPEARVLLPFAGGKWDLDSPADLLRFQSFHATQT